MSTKPELYEIWYVHAYTEHGCTDDNGPNSNCPVGRALYTAYEDALPEEKPAHTVTLVQAVRDHAQAHYNEGGWDAIVEAYEDKDIIESIGDATTPEDAIARIALTVEILADHQQDMTPIAGWHY